MPEIEQITGPISAHGEGPVWSAQWGGLRFLDLNVGDVLALDDSGEVRRSHVGPMVAAIRPRHGSGSSSGSGSGMALALDRGFALTEQWDGPVERLPELWSDTHVRFNDGGCDPDGNFLCGSTGDDYSAGRGSMYRLNADHSAELLFGDLGVSNGLAWTADGHTAYYADTLTERIDQFDYDRERGLHNRRPLVQVESGKGLPDGLCVDTEGYLWVALWSGGAVHRYGPDGRLDAVLEFPVQRVTACTLGGANLDELYVTTSRNEAPEHEATTAGALFRVAVGVRGLPVLPYRG